jgi:hypothetical protein
MYREIEEAEEIGCVPMRRSRVKLFIQRQTPGLTMNASISSTSSISPLEFPRLRRLAL